MSKDKEPVGSGLKLLLCIVNLIGWVAIIFMMIPLGIMTWLLSLSSPFQELVFLLMVVFFSVAMGKSMSAIVKM